MTLEGVVDSDADKNLAGVRANGVSGIFSVTNNLQVSSIEMKEIGGGATAFPLSFSMRGKSIN